MKQFIREVKPSCDLYRDTNTGIAWIQDGSTGMSVSIHANIDSTGSIRGMKQLGYWNKSDRIIKSHGFNYNIDTFVCDKNNELEMIVASECNCDSCIKRRKMLLRK